MDSPILSICIPSYNSRIRLYDNIMEMLEVPSDEFEIIVCDNASEKGCVDLIKQLQDKRVKVYRNASNIGMFSNFYEALMKGSGKYVHLCTDRDYIKKSKIAQYIELLKKTEADIVHSYKCSKNGFLSKEEAVYYLMAGAHPSRYAFRREALAGIRGYCSVYYGCPAMYWSIQILVSGKYYLNSEIDLPQTANESYLRKTPSTSYAWRKTENKLSGSAVPFQPQYYYCLFAVYSRMILNIHGQNKKMLFFLYKYCIYDVIAAPYFTAKTNSYVLERFHIPKMDLKIRDCIKYNIMFYKSSLAWLNKTGFYDRDFSMIMRWLNIYSFIQFLCLALNKKETIVKLLDVKAKHLYGKILKKLLEIN